MAGTDTSQTLIPDNTPIAPAIILVRPQLGLNIGMCARAMLNCAVTELRIVAPRDGWPNDDAIASSSGATHLLDNAKLYDTTADAVADLEFVFATTARDRGMVKEIYTAEAAGRKLREVNTGAEKTKCGILFGPERTGLENEDTAMANAILNIPLNPGFSSLNLAQAVLLVSYSWLSADNPFGKGDIVAEGGDSLPATKAEIENLMIRLEDALEEGKFFRSPEQKPTILLNLRNFFFRSNPTAQEIRTLHGVFANLLGRRTWKQK